MSRKSTSKTEIAAPGVSGGAQHLALFGPPPLLEGEDAVAYDEFLARVRAAVKPVDIIDEIFIADVVSLEWEVLRCRRLKWNLIRASAIAALEVFLPNQLDYNHYSKQFEDDLAENLQDNLPEDEADSAHTLARECARHEPHAVDKVNEILEPAGDSIDSVRSWSMSSKARELMRQYVRCKPNAVRLVHRLLAKAGKSMETFMAGALAKTLDQTERIDRLITIAENRRNASLCEIDGLARPSAKRCDRAWKKLQTLSLK
jgi:hypothetical protein